jgi:hypothetical protein
MNGGVSPGTSRWGQAVPNGEPRRRERTVIAALLFTGGGFLVAVLWFDLMFDVQALGPDVSVAAIGSIAAYYRRVTTEAVPMSHLVAVVMATVLVASLVDAARAADRRMMRLAAFLLAAAPILLAAVRVFPNAVTLGREAGPDSVQIALARAILRDHFVCLTSILCFLALRIGLAAGAGK